MADPENNIVREWLRTLDLSHHLDNFIDNGYDDLETCKQIGEEDMDAIGVQDPQQREELRHAVARLKQEGGTAVYFTLMGPETDYVYEEDVAVDYGYAEDEDDKVHSMLDSGSSGICDCRNCECLQESQFDVGPQCYLDRHRWKWTEHHLRRGSFESATEYRRMMLEHPNQEALVSKPRSSSAVEHGGFVEAMGGMSPHEQQRRMFRSFKDSAGRSQHSGSSLTSTGSDSSSGPTSPEHAMTGSTEDGTALGESSELKKGHSQRVKGFFKKLMKTPSEAASSKQGAAGSEWRASDSKLSNEEILQTMNLIKENSISVEDAWNQVKQKEAQRSMGQAIDVGSGGCDMAEDSKPKQPSNGSRSDIESPTVTSDKDSALDIEEPSAVSPHKHGEHTYDEPPSELEERLILPYPSRLEPGSDNLPPDDTDKSEDVLPGMIYRNKYAGEDPTGFGDAGPPLEPCRADSAEPQHQRRDRTSSSSDGSSTALQDKGEYLEPMPQFVTGIPKRSRAKSSPADPTAFKAGKSIKNLLFGPKTKHLTTPSPEGSSTDRFSDPSDGSLEHDGTISSCTSTSSKSSGDAESRQPSYEVEPNLLNSRGEYCGIYMDIGIVNKDVSPNPHDVEMLPFKAGEMVYITKKQGGNWEGVCGKRRGKFKFIHVDVLSPEQLEKEKRKRESLYKDEDSDGTPSEVMPKFANLRQLLERIGCKQYENVLHFHDFGTLEQFKYLEEANLEHPLNITDQKDITTLTTAAKMLRDPKAGKDRAASQQMQGLFGMTRSPKGRTIVRDSGFYASTETCMSFDSSGLHVHSEASDSLIEECEPGYHGEEVVTSSSDDTLQENSNVNNSNCINVLQTQNGTNKGGRMSNSPCRHGSMTTVQSNPHLGNGHQALGSPTCPRKEGNGSASPLAHHVCRVHTNGASTKCAQQQHFNPLNPSWNGPSPRDSPSFKHRHLMATFSDPGSVPNSPRLRPGQRPVQRCPMQSGRSIDHQCPSPDVVPHISNDDIARWRKSALLEMYGVQDPSRLRCSGSFLQSSLAKTHPSPKLPRRVMEQYHCHALQSAPLRPASPSQQRGRRKSRSVSPHHHKQHHHHHHHHERLLSHNSVHASPTLPLRPSKSSPQQAPAQLEWHVERTLRQEGIDLKEEPYSNKMGFCGIPPALTQRYAEELDAEITEVAVCLESIRVRDLVDACRCWFRSDALASQSSKLVYAGTGNSVEDWLTSLGLPMYIEAFTLSGWDELDIVIHMDKDDLRRCGIDRAGHLRRLSTALEHLKMSWKPV